MEPRIFAFAFIHALHSMAMVELLSGDDEFYVTPPKKMKALIELFWQGLQPARHLSGKPGKQKLPRLPRKPTDEETVLIPSTLIRVIRGE